jgi:hypothetical protein
MAPNAARENEVGNQQAGRKPRAASGDGQVVGYFKASIGIFHASTHPEQSANREPTPVSAWRSAFVRP